MKYKLIKNVIGDEFVEGGNANLDVFSPKDFDEENPKVAVYGNLVEATQGKSEKEAIQPMRPWSPQA